MEKILSNSEKIRRAEEIYARRKGMQIISDEYIATQIWNIIKDG